MLFGKEKQMPEISDGMKHDLGMVLCDQRGCTERSQRARCYLDIFRLCEKYRKGGAKCSEAGSTSKPQTVRFSA